MITKFSKGFYGKPREHAAFLSAVADGDCAEIEATLGLSGSERSFVDPFVNAMPRRAGADNRLLNMPLDSHPAPDSVEFLDELDIVYQVAEDRDIPLEELPKTLPRGYRELSPFLSETKVPAYKKGVAYGVDDQEWQMIQSGYEMGDVDLESERSTRIKTVRDAAAYVHKDHFLIPWLEVLSHIVKEGAPLKVPEALEVPHLDHTANFAIYGEPFWAGVLGEVLAMVGHVSFHMKWQEMYPRPEEIGHFYGKPHLGLAYPEGSPMHPSRNAMHSAVALAMAEAIKLISDPSYRLALTGETLGSSVDLKADNVGYFRVLGGVHYPSDHDSFRMIAKEVAEVVVSKYLRAR